MMRTVHTKYKILYTVHTIVSQCTQWCTMVHNSAHSVQTFAHSMHDVHNVYTMMCSANNDAQCNTTMHTVCTIVYNVHNDVRSVHKDVHSAHNDAYSMQNYVHSAHNDAQWKTAMIQRT